MTDTRRILSGPIRPSGPLHPGQLSALLSVDEVVREARSKNETVEWLLTILSGDLAAQHTIERELVREGHTRATIGREEFSIRLREREEEALQQLRNVFEKLGVSADLDKATVERAAVSRAARTAFVRLFESGLVRREYLVAETCPRCETVVDSVDADPDSVDVEWEVIELRVVDDQETTLRLSLDALELLLGTVAVAVPEGHSLIGSKVEIPFTDRSVPVVKSDFDEPVIVAPAHDAGGLEIARQMSLDPIMVMDVEGVIRIAGPFEGLSRFAARESIRQTLAENGLIVDARSATTRVARCRRCTTVLVPRLGWHWMLDMSELQHTAADAVREGAVSFSSTEARDAFLESGDQQTRWCLSHQLWVGEPVPIARCLDCGYEEIAVESDASCGTCMGTLEPDDGVLDARFIGAIWPLAAAGWPDDESAVGALATETTLHVGQRGLEVWALPMAALGLWLSRAIPFAHVAVTHTQAPDHPIATMTPAELSEFMETEPADVVRKTLTGGADELHTAPEVAQAQSQS